jgi:hypothetical protein
MTRRGSAQKRASAAPSFHNTARFAEECQSIPSKMIALLLALSCPPPSPSEPDNFPVLQEMLGVFQGPQMLPNGHRGSRLFQF